MVVKRADRLCSVPSCEGQPLLRRSLLGPMLPAQRACRAIPCSLLHPKNHSSAHWYNRRALPPPTTRSAGEWGGVGCIDNCCACTQAGVLAHRAGPLRAGGGAYLHKVDASMSASVVLAQGKPLPAAKLPALARSNPSSCAACSAAATLGGSKGQVAVTTTLVSPLHAFVGIGRLQVHA